MTTAPPSHVAAAVMRQKLWDASTAIIKRVDRLNSTEYQRWETFSQANPAGHRRIMGQGVCERGNKVEAIIEDHYTSPTILEHVATWDPYTCLIVAHLLTWIYDDLEDRCCELPPAPAVALAEAILDAR